MGKAVIKTCTSDYENCSAMSIPTDVTLHITLFSKLKSLEGMTMVVIKSHSSGYEDFSAIIMTVDMSLHIVIFSISLERVTMVVIKSLQAAMRTPAP
jgi:hypothetical protein